MEYLADQVRAAVTEALAALGVPEEARPADVPVDRPEAGRGDLATPVAFALARALRRPPPAIAAEVAERLAGRTDLFAGVRASGGFVNLEIAPGRLAAVAAEAARAGAAYGARRDGEGTPPRSVLVEHTSANPTGPLHVGHGRGAAVGDSLARLLARTGRRVVREYYLNDAGRQVALLGRSVRRAAGLEAGPPDPDEYRGEYVAEVGAAAREALGEAPVERYAEWAAERLLGEIRADLEAFGVTFDSWYSERSLWEAGAVDRALEHLRARGLLYRAERPEVESGRPDADAAAAGGGAAEWFRSSVFGDDADRVVVRADGAPTYFAADLAYHADKAGRGFDEFVNVWGQDHHGYVARVRAALAAFGEAPEALHVVLVQLVRVFRGGREVRMSKRTGTYVTLREVVEEVGRDAARFFFLLRSPDAHLDFDLDLAKKQAPENPVFYVQYVHARVASLLAEAAARGVEVPPASASAPAEAPEERALALEIALLPDVYRAAAARMEPHRLTAAALALAGAFHRFYTAHRILGAPAERERARLALARATGIAVRGLLETIGASAPERM